MADKTQIPQSKGPGVGPGAGSKTPPPASAKVPTTKTSPNSSKRGPQG